MLDVSKELGRARLGSQRLSRRLEETARRMATKPGATLPVAMGDTSGREGAYRLLSNRKVSLRKVLAPHVEATLERSRKAGRVLVVSDTTDFKFSTEREGLGPVNTQLKDGFLGHFTLAVSSDGKRTPLGLLGIETLVRQGRPKAKNHFARKKDPTRESLRWQRCAEAASEKLDGVEAIHVMDAEADIYELLAGLKDKGRRFIIRSAQNRSVESGRLFESLEELPVVLEREVQLSARPGAKQPGTRRSHPPRRQRLARLRVSVRDVAIQKATSAVDPALPDAVRVNVVRVREFDAPAGQEPVEWRLLTTEPVQTQRQIEDIIDGYRARWVIEEYFKALKTGCNFESSQLESFSTLENLLGIQATIAWQLLALRSAARDEPNGPGAPLLSPTQLQVLRLLAKKPLPPSPTAAEVMTAIAALGAHIKQNGPPGWIVLSRGFEELLRAEFLYSRMNSVSSRDQS